LVSVVGTHQDLTDDAVVATASGPETLECTDKGLAAPLRVGCDRREDGFQCGMSHHQSLNDLSGVSVAGSHRLLATHFRSTSLKRQRVGAMS
jgi:hypothetical protein